MEDKKIYSLRKIFERRVLPMELQDYIQNNETRFGRGYNSFQVQKYKLKEPNHPFFDEDEREENILHNSLVDFLRQNDCQNGEFVLINQDW